LARAALPADPVAAAELLGRAAWLRREYELAAGAYERAAADRALAAVRTALGPAESAAAAARGAADEAAAARPDG
jgi:hypothetical protein